MRCTTHACSTCHATVTDKLSHSAIRAPTVQEMTKCLSAQACCLSSKHDACTTSCLLRSRVARVTCMQPATVLAGIALQEGWPFCMRQVRANKCCHTTAGESCSRRRKCHKHGPTNEQIHKQTAVAPSCCFGQSSVQVPALASSSVVHRFVWLRLRNSSTDSTCQFANTPLSPS